MLKISRIILLFIAVLSIVTILVFFAFKQAKILHRDPVVLMNRYYLLKQENPEAAQQALIIILRQDQNYLPALRELSQIYIHEKNNRAALPLVKRLHELFPDDPHHTLQLAQLYYHLKEWQKAYPLFKQLSEGAPGEEKGDSFIMLEQMASSVPYYKTLAAIDVIKEKNKEEMPQVTQILLNLFYKIRQDTPQQAKDLLEALDLITQDNYLIHEEMGYIALQRGDTAQAISSFSRYQHISPRTCF